MMRAPSRPTSSESALYDGNIMLGAVELRDREYRAFDARGKRLGTFKTSRDAARAIIAAVKANRPQAESGQAQAAEMPARQAAGKCGGAGKRRGRAAS